MTTRPRRPWLFLDSIDRELIVESSEPFDPTVAFSVELKDMVTNDVVTGYVHEIRGREVIVSLDEPSSFVKTIFMIEKILERQRWRRPQLCRETGLTSGPVASVLSGCRASPHTRTLVANLYRRLFLESSDDSVLRLPPPSEETARDSDDEQDRQEVIDLRTCPALVTWSSRLSATDLKNLASALDCLATRLRREARDYEEEGFADDLA